MAEVARTLSFAGRACRNYFTNRPLCVSFEVTHNCNARCRHCHLGPPKTETLAPPERYGELCRTLKPIVAQVSGGEPLLRSDLETVVQALSRRHRPPHVVLTTNGALLTPERHARLREAGVRDFSLSFDYPDERHDEFRQIPGLFARIDGLMRGLAANGTRHGITLACVVQRGNFRELTAIAQKALEWKAGVNFSSYTWLRTGNKDMLVPPEELPELKDVLGRLLDFKRRHGNVFTSDYVLAKMPEYFQRGALPDCRAGERFLVVNPDGTLSPCGLIIRAYRTRGELLESFTRANDCGDCYTSLRANTEKPPYWLIRDSLSRV